jgi:hypothetical protein
VSKAECETRLSTKDRKMATLEFVRRSARNAKADITWHGKQFKESVEDGYIRPIAEKSVQDDEM